MKLEAIITGEQTSVVTIATDASIAEAVHLLSQHSIGALVVSSVSNSIEGMLSERDIVRSLDSADQDTMSLQVHQLMTADVHTCSMDSTVAELMSLMTTKRIRHVPVVNDGQLYALVSIGDLVSARLNELESERQHIQDYISG
ncbi:MAG: CBS domain-containing protein [Granulosicoccus sp.]